MNNEMYGLIGESLGHSYSQYIHKELGNSEYGLIELSNENMKEYMSKASFKGVNVTIPYKHSVCEYCNELSDEAQHTKVVNTLVNDNNTIKGYNTDIYGMESMITKAGIELEGKKVLILGHGGTSSTAMYVAEKMGARDIVVAARKVDEYISIDYKLVPFSLMEAYVGAQIIINTTPVGMYPNNLDSIVDLEHFTELEGVVEVVYNPRRTSLIMQANRLGIKHTDALYMLVAQAAKSHELFKGDKVSISDIDKIVNVIRKRMDNIILIGMPGSGKTSIGKAIATRLDREFVDIDNVVSDDTGLSVPDIFSIHGEETFRRLENVTIAREGKRQGIVIATGGGSIIDEDNYEPLHQNGTIYYIKRDINKLSMIGRPLSKSLDELADMLDSRKHKYEEYADIIIDNEDDNIEEVVDSICNKSM